MNYSGVGKTQGIDGAKRRRCVMAGETRCDKHSVQ